MSNHWNTTPLSHSYLDKSLEPLGLQVGEGPCDSGSCAMVVHSLKHELEYSGPQKLDIHTTFTPLNDDELRSVLGGLFDRVNVGMTLYYPINKSGFRDPVQVFFSNESAFSTGRDTSHIPAHNDGASYLSSDFFLDYMLNIPDIALPIAYQQVALEDPELLSELVRFLVATFAQESSNVSTWSGSMGLSGEDVASNYNPGSDEGNSYLNYVFTNLGSMFGMGVYPEPGFTDLAAKSSVRAEKMTSELDLLNVHGKMFAFYLRSKGDLQRADLNATVAQSLRDNPTLIFTRQEWLNYLDYISSENQMGRITNLEDMRSASAQYSIEKVCSENLDLPCIAVGGYQDNIFTPSRVMP